MGKLACTLHSDTQDRLEPADTIELRAIQMSKMTKFTAALVSLAALASSNTALAGITVTASVGGAPTGAILDNLDALPLGGVGGITATGILVTFTSDGKAVTGQTSQNAPPFLSGLNAAGFGNSPAAGQDASVYLTTGLGSTTLDFGTDLHYVGLLWGSVDSYNTLKLYDLGVPVATIVESDFTNNVNGNQGTNGTYYVNIGTTFSFDEIVAYSTQYAFEFDNIAYSPDQFCPTCGTTGILVPEP